MNYYPAVTELLLAQMERFSGLRDRFSGPRARFGWEDALTAVVAIVAVSALLYLLNYCYSRYANRQNYNSPASLFRELCKAHRLDRQARHLLWRVARWQRLSHPARLFLEPERFEPINLSPELEQHSAELFELRGRLFAFEITAEEGETVERDAQGAPLHAPDYASHRGASVFAEERREHERLGSSSQQAVGAVAFATTRLQEPPVEKSQ